MATTPGNAINETTTGITGFTGTAFVGTAVTQYDVLVGGATSSTISSVGPGSAGQILQSGGNAANPAYSTATYPSTATSTGTILRADGTNWVATTSTYPNTNAVSTLLYASSANVMAALATANGGVLTTSSSGVPSIDTTNFSVLSTGVQMKGNNTNTAPPAGFIGQQITSGSVTGVSVSTGTPKSITNITITAGVWDITAFGYCAFSANVGSSFIVGISTTDNTLEGNYADQKYFYNSTTATLSAFSGIVPAFRVLLSSNTTYYLVMQCNFGSGTGTAQARLSAVRVG